MIEIILQQNRRNKTKIILQNFKTKKIKTKEIKGNILIEEEDYINKENEIFLFIKKKDKTSEINKLKKEIKSELNIIELNYLNFLEFSLLELKIKNLCEDKIETKIIELIKEKQIELNINKNEEKTIYVDKDNLNGFVIKTEIKEGIIEIEINGLISIIQ